MALRRSARIASARDAFHWSEDLPDFPWEEVMHLITGPCTSLQISDPDALRCVRSVRLVCQSWRSHCDEHIKKLKLSRPRRPITILMMRSFLQRFTAVQAVIMEDATRQGGVQRNGPVWGDAVESLAPTVTTLVYGGGSYGRDYFTVLERFTALTTLRLRSSCRFQDVHGLERLVTLETLDLRGASLVLTDDAFRSLSGLTRLTDLDLLGCDKIGAPLQPDGLTLSTDGFKTLSFFTGLTSLNLEETLANDTVLLETVSGLSALKRLWLTLFAFNLWPFPNGIYGQDRPLITQRGLRELSNILPEIRLLMYEETTTNGYRRYVDNNIGGTRTYVGTDRI